jgi:catechol 2,3-dioxygenase-like lactoylglutathione lyase family enzyme
MIKTISHCHLWVLDQDEALRFYTEKVGLEVRADVKLGPESNDYRWLTVGVPGRPEVEMILADAKTSPGSAEVAGQVEDLVAHGAAGGMIFTVDDCQATYEDLKGRGVEFVQEPTERFYGIDAAFRDPFGNHMRFTQRAEEA